jgi:hypothetical protein
MLNSVQTSSLIFERSSKVYLYVKRVEVKHVSNKVAHLSNKHFHFFLYIYV